jgi:hypothetical protein
METSVLLNYAARGSNPAYLNYIFTARVVHPK